MKKLALLISVFAIVFSVIGQNIAITDDNGYTVDPSAMLDVKATDKGVLIPRVTSAQRTAISTPANGLLVFDINDTAFYFFNGTGWISLSNTGDIWTKSGNDIHTSNLNDKIGVGTTAPVGKLEVKADAAIAADEPIFEVINANGDTVFAVYPEGVRIYVDDNPAKATGSKGGFAVGGFSDAKGITNEYLRITPDSVRIYIDEDFTAVKSTGSKGGFAVGGFSDAKGLSNNSYLYVIDDSTRVYSVDSTAGFEVGTIEGGNTDGFLNMTKRNYFIGHKSGEKNISGDINTFFGYNTGLNNVSGSKNVFVGFQSGFFNQSGYENIFVGNRSGFKNISGYNNTFLGNQSGHENIAGFNNIFIGNQSGFSNIGDGGGNGSFNTFLGVESGNKNISGSSNTFLGYQSGSYNTTGIDNTYIGRWAGAGNPPATPGCNGSYNVFIGSEAGRFEQGSYKLCIDARNTPVYQSPLIYGEFDTRRVVISGDNNDNPLNYTFYVNGTAGGDFPWNNLSDKRLKKNINTIPDALNKVMALRGVSYEWKDPESIITGTQIGFIAQEAEKVIPEVVTTTGDYYSMSYAPITALLVEAIKEQQKIIDELKNDNNQLRSEVDKIEALQTQINELREILKASASK